MSIASNGQRESDSLKIGVKTLRFFLVQNVKVKALERDTSLLNVELSQFKQQVNLLQSENENLNLISQQKEVGIIILKQSLKDTQEQISKEIRKKKAIRTCALIAIPASFIAGGWFALKLF